jgi:hypothetical protein
VHLKKNGRIITGDRTYFNPRLCKLLITEQKGDDTTKKVPAKFANYESLSFLSENELKQLLEMASELHVTPELEKPHRVLQKHQVAFKKWTKRHPRDKYADWNHDKYRRKPEEEPPLWNSVTVETLPRVYRNPDFSSSIILTMYEHFY